MTSASPGWSNLADSLPAAWQDALGPVGRDALARIGNELSQRALREQIIPGPHQVFRALLTPPSSVKVLIIGQDPYPNPHHAMGLSFSVPREVSPLPPTAINIRRELASDLGLSLAPHFDLESWVAQGALLLNRHLTTVAGQPGSHRSLGWTEITDRIVHHLVSTQPRLVSVLWGREAKAVIPLLGDTAWLESAHPSPLSARRGFFGSRPFSRVNALLATRGVPAIDWSIR